MTAHFLALIHNVKAGTFHPVLFRPSPLPGPGGPGTPMRHKSQVHHTAGFPTKDEAVANFAVFKSPDRWPDAVEKPDIVFPWDGEGVPALVFFFGEVEEE